MLVPSIIGNNLFDDWFSFPDFARFGRPESRPYDRHPVRIMKTDVHEHDDRYDMDIELPGYAKDEIELSLDNGYLSVKAAKDSENKETDDNGVLIRRERYCGSVQRSFYVGDSVTEDDIKARFENGILNLSIQKPVEKIPEKKTIYIEG